MKFFFDLFPVILFFVAFKLSDIYTATAVAILATVLQLGFAWAKHHKIEPMLWVNLGIISVFGGMTLLLHDETFIKWKPTVLYWVFAVTLAGSALFFRKNLIRALLEKQMDLPESFWGLLNWSWVAFFTLMGVANLAIAFAFGLSTETWVNFKVFGGIGLMLAFVIAQGILLSKYVKEEE